MQTRFHPLLLLTCFAVTFGSASPLHAQQARLPDLQDRRARVSVGDSTFEGIVQSLSPSALQLGLAGAAGPRAFEWTALDRLEVMRVHRQTGKGALIGGALLGLLAGSVTESLRSCPLLGGECDDVFHAQAFFGGFATGGLAGAGVGALIGSLVRDESWTVMYLPSVPGGGSMSR